VDVLVAFVVDTMRRTKLKTEEWEAWPEQRSSIEALLANTSEVQRRALIMLARQRPMTMVELFARIRPLLLPLGPDGRANPILCAALPGLAISDDQRAMVQQAWEMYSKRTAEARQELRAGLFHVSEAAAAASASQWSAAWASASAYLQSYDAASVLAAHTAREIEALWMLVTDMECIFTVAQRGALMSACSPHIICPLQLCALLGEADSSI
jgi:hypothetical protein